jgi:hypothetical protein
MVASSPLNYFKKIGVTKFLPEKCDFNLYKWIFFSRKEMAQIGQILMNFLFQIAKLKIRISLTLVYTYMAKFG